MHAWDTDRAAALLRGALSGESNVENREDVLCVVRDDVEMFFLPKQEGEEVALKYADSQYDKAEVWFSFHSHIFDTDLVVGANLKTGCAKSAVRGLFKEALDVLF